MLVELFITHYETHCEGAKTEATTAVVQTSVLQLITFLALARCWVIEAVGEGEVSRVVRSVRPDAKSQVY